LRRCVRMLVMLATCLQIGGCLVGGSYGNGWLATSGAGGASGAGGGGGVLPAIPPYGGGSLIQTVPTGGFFGGSGFAVGGTFGSGFSPVVVQQGSFGLGSP
jgi:hypothetical protein